MVSNKGFTKSIGLISILNFAGVLASVASTLVIAYLFGVSRQVEVFFAASQVFTVFVTLAQTGQLTEAFIPVFHRLKAELSLSHAFKASSVLLNWILIFATVLAGVIALFASEFTGLLVPGFEAAEKDSVASLVLILCPLIILQVMLAFFKAMGHAQKLYGWPEAVAVLGTLVQLAIIIGFYEHGALALAWGLIANVILQFLVMLIALMSNGYRHHFVLFVDFFEAGTVFRRLYATSFYVLCAQGAGVAMTASLSGLPQGVYAAYSYALRMYSKAGSVLLRPISIVFFTNFSEAFARGSESLRKLAVQALSRSALVISLAILIMLGSADYFLTALLTGEKFPLEKIELTEMFLSLFTISYLLTGFGQIARKINVAVGEFDLQYYLLAFCQLLYGAFIFVLIPWLGISGIFLVIGMQALLPSLACGLLLYYRNREFFAFYDLSLLGKWIASVSSGLLIAGLLSYSLHLSLSDSRIENLVYGILVLSASLLVSLFVAKLLKITELEMAYQVFKNKIVRDSKSYR